MARLRGRALTAASLCLLFGCSGGAWQDVAPATTRAAAYRACPRFLVEGLAPPFSVVERSLPNLGENHHGRIERWTDGSASVTFYAGHDVFDDLEDLDFSQREATTATRSYVIHETTVDPSLVAVSWTERSASGPCADITVVARKLPGEELLRVADDTRLVTD